MDAAKLIRNCNDYPFENLRRYLGQHVAWRIDGQTIIDGDADPAKLLKRLEGLDPDTYILDFIPPLRELTVPGDAGHAPDR